MTRARPPVAIATITWARSPEEDRRLRRALTRLIAAGFPIAVADSGRTPAFSAFLDSRPELTVTVERSGLVAQVEASLQLASKLGSRFVLYTESDKAVFFEGMYQKLFFEGGSQNALRFKVGLRVLF